MSDKISLYIIDDDPIVNVITQYLLNKFHPEIESQYFENGKLALDEIIKNNFFPKYIFLDLNMPVLNGWEFLEKINPLQLTNKEKLKIIVLSSTLDRLDIDKAKEHIMVTKFISKPITIESLEIVFKDQF